MIPVVVLALGGLIWYSGSKRQPGGNPQSEGLDPRMSPALRAEVMKLLGRDLPAEKLESLASEFARAHYHRAAALMAARARQIRALTPKPVAPNGRVLAQALHARLDGEMDPRVLRRVAEALEVVGQSALAREVIARAQSLESETLRADAEPGIEPARGASIEDLLRVTEREAQEDLDALGKFGLGDDVEGADDDPMGDPADDPDDAEMSGGDPMPDAYDDESNGGADPAPDAYDTELRGGPGRSEAEMIAATFAAMERQAPPTTPGQESANEEAPRASTSPHSGEHVTADGVITTAGVLLEDSVRSKRAGNGSKAQRRRISSKGVGGHDGS